MLDRSNIAERVTARVQANPATRPEPEIGSGTQLSERAQAITDWCMDATIHAPDGRVMVEHQRLCGDREYAEAFAAIIDQQLTISLDENDLAILLGNPRGQFRMYQLAPLIAADLMRELRDLGHV